MLNIYGYFYLPKIDKCKINNHGEISREFPKYIYKKLDLVLEKSFVNGSKINEVFIFIKKLINKYYKK